MNSNVKTLMRVRKKRIPKFAALNLNTEDGGGMGMDEPPETAEEDPCRRVVLTSVLGRSGLGLKGGATEGGVELEGRRRGIA